MGNEVRKIPIPSLFCDRRNNGNQKDLFFQYWEFPVQKWKLKNSVRMENVMPAGHIVS